VIGTINAYLSMRAALVAVLRHNAGAGRPIRSLAVPGLCTGVGGMHPAEAAEQMKAAYDSVVGGKWREVDSPVLAPYALRRSGA
jgi:O-acetyl-ADP-ribose deacetylase (regulator of RNase III)